MSTELVYVALDVSKGYADGAVLTPEGSRLPRFCARYDDTAAGHAAWHQQLNALRALYPQAQFRLGMECSGGLERNWLAAAVAWVGQATHQVYQLNPLAVKRHRQRELHANTTDAQSALAIADYLRQGLRTADRPYAPREAGPRVRLHFLWNQQQRASQLQNELQSLLPAVHPELVRYCRKGLPGWVLRVLSRYPTAPHLARARAATLARIPHVSLPRAQQLILAAQQSVGALADAETALTITELVQEIQRLLAVTKVGKAALTASWAQDSQVKRLQTIPGIGLWAAVVLRLELGELTRFRSAAAVIASAGVDPCYHESGDGRRELRISKRGAGIVRGTLYMAVVAGQRWNPVIRAYYQQLVARGKHSEVAMTACMAKLLRLAYACVQRATDWDPQHVSARPAPTAPTAPAGPTDPGSASPGPAELAATPAAERADTAAVSVGSLAAPVSYREAQRRKQAQRAAARPPKGTRPQARGPGATRSQHTTAS